MKKVLFKNDYLELEGKELHIGDKAEDFVVYNQNLEEVKLSDFKGKKVVITTFPSIDTSVCAMQTREFNEIASKIDNVIILTISQDLPFALKRFCAANGIENIQVLSDYRTRDFSKKYGLLIKELQLLSRSVVIVNEEGNIQYIEIVENTSTEPNYDLAIKELKK